MLRFTRREDMGYRPGCLDAGQIAADASATCIEPDTVSSAIERYVEDLRAGLRGADAAATAETCEEIRLHLRASTQARIELGETPEAAEREALIRFGASTVQVSAIADQLHRKTLRTDRRAAFRFALKTYGAVAAIDLVSATIFAYLTSTTRFHSVLAYWSTYCIFWLLSGSALVTGWQVGSQTASRAVRATLAAHLCVVATLLLISGIFAAVIYLVDGFCFLRYPDSPGQTFVNMAFGIACYHVTRTPLSLVAAWAAGRPKRNHSPRLKV